MLPSNLASIQNYTSNNVSINGSLSQAQSPYRSKAKDKSTYIVTDEFNSSYYSGADINIYFDDFFLDDIQSLQYQVTENVLPIFGYHSYSYDFAARGNKIIQGSFTINFKRSFYIQELLVHLTSRELNPDLTEKQKDVLITRLKNSVTMEELLAQVKSNGTNTIKSDELDKIAQNNIKNFWPQVGSSNSSPPRNVPMFQRNMSQGFTIFIKYGEPVLADNDKPLKGNDPTQGLPIENIGTIQAVRGTQISSSGVVLDDSGRPILEVYSFLAKDIVQGS